MSVALARQSSERTEVKVACALRNAILAFHRKVL